MTYADAAAYTATTPLSGLAQLAVLRAMGWLRDDAAVLEYGCGVLHLAKGLLADRAALYYGMDPNAWLREAARAEDPLLDRLADGGDFSGRDDFDACAAFGADHFVDLVFAHSVLSHASHAQLSAFYLQAHRALASGRCVATLNLSDAPTMGDEWVYPDAITVSLAEVEAAALEAGFSEVLVVETARELYTSWCPLETHDWIIAF